MTRRGVALHAVDPEALLVSQVDEILQQLTAREEQILRLRFGLDRQEHDAEEVSRHLGVSRSRVRMIETQALGRLRMMALVKVPARCIATPGSPQRRRG